MISFLEMVQRYPIGAKIDISDEKEGIKTREIVGYEYYNGTGFLVFGNKEKMSVEQLSGGNRPKLY